MGLDRTIRFPTAPPTWEAIHAQLAKIGELPQLRMIDGLPAFPDEVPEAGWNELRIGFPAGMITLRRGTDALMCVVWGNAEGLLRTAWDRLCWACAQAGSGSIETPTGSVTATEFAQSNALMPS